MTSDALRRRFFKRAGPFSVASLAQVSGAEVVRGGELFCEDVATLQGAGAKDIAVLHNSKYLEALKATRAGVCLVKQDWVQAAPKSSAILVSETPHRAFAKIAQAFYPEDVISPAIDSSARVDPTASLGKGCSIGPGVVIGPGAVLGEGCAIGANSVIGENVILGDGCRVGPHVTLTHAVVGDRVLIKPGARIGQRGFGFSMENPDVGNHISVPQLGVVRIGNDVEIGSNATLDRGSLQDTVIEDGVRIDNLVQIAHNVHLGKGSVVVAQVGIAGSTVVGDFSVFGGQVGLSGHLHIAPGTQVAAKSGVMRDTKPGEVLAGIPAVPIKDWHRQSVHLMRLGKKDSKK